MARDPKRLDDILSETKTRGYGLRDQAFLGGPYGVQSPDGLAGIAVPLLDRGRVDGVVNIIWPRADAYGRGNGGAMLAGPSIGSRGDRALAAATP